MNKHIELVKKWLADNDSVSAEELEAAFYASRKLYAAAEAAYIAAHAAYTGNSAGARFWIEGYEKLTK